MRVAVGLDQGGSNRAGENDQVLDSFSGVKRSVDALDWGIERIQ